MTDYSAGSGDEQVEQRQATAPIWALLTKTWQAFGLWRRTRPFGGALLIIAGASEMLASEQAPLPVVTRIGIRGLGGYLTPTFMLLCGVLLLVTPIARTYHSFLAIVLAIDSWLTSNLGGFLIGMFAGIVGGALSFAWMTDVDYDTSEWLRGIPRIRLRSWVMHLTSRVKGLPAGRLADVGLAGSASIAFLKFRTGLRKMHVSLDTRQLSERVARWFTRGS